MNSIESLRSWAAELCAKCSSWIVPGDDGMARFCDPIDRCEISAHYGATHAAAALIIWGELIKDQATIERGISLFESILNRWEQSVHLPSFHNDFNNFALCVAEGYMSSLNEDLAARIRQTVLSTPDSNHSTVNWLPMRAFVNSKRFDWSCNPLFDTTRNKCLSYINRATNSDGGIEDRLPRKTSFNLQYDVATVSLLQFLRVSGQSLDLSGQLGFLVNAVAPDGDINYQGRGTNQIFAWGPWLYLLASAGREDDLTLALTFLADKLPVMLQNNNILLNEHCGEEKHLWWDYHYASVYIAHFFFWLVLSIRDYAKAPIVPIVHETGASGLHISRGKDFFVASFDGRDEYLAERGPTIVAIWTRSCGSVFKGSFGPWKGLFGNLHCPEETVLSNYWGVMIAKPSSDIHQNRFVRRLLPKLTIPVSWSMKPLFVRGLIRSDNPEYIEVEYSVTKGSLLNLPVFEDSSYIPHVYSGKDEMSPVTCNYLISNQYATAKVFRTSRANASVYIVRIPK